MYDFQIKKIDCFIILMVLFIKMTNYTKMDKKHSYMNWSSKNPYISIYQDTVTHCVNCKFLVHEPLKYNYDSDEFTNDNFLAQYVPFDKLAKILVENIDSFDMARNMNSKVERVLVLNLASDISPGGGVESGARAQEEDLYCKSNYFEANSRNLYPLRISEAIYSPIVHIIKDKTYKLLQEPYPVSCLAIAALQNPKLKILSEGKITYSNEKDMKIMQNKIDMIFKVAIKHGHKMLVLGALGCGVFNNPTEEVANMFKKSLNKYAPYFKTIGFAILCGPSNPNFTIFQNVIN